MTTILIVEDHSAIVDGLRAGLSQVEGLTVQAVASSLMEGRSVLSRSGPFDIAIVDVRLGTWSGFELLEVMDTDRTAVVIFSGCVSSAYLEGARRLGARGYLLKSSPMARLVASVAEVAAGGTAWDRDALQHRRDHPWRPLTVRERDVVRWLLAGWSNKQISHKLGITTKTVESHLTDLYVAHGVHSRSELALLADREGWLDVPAW
ncbi:MAG: response regulator transcription factor [Chloroflexota bacterium]